MDVASCAEGGAVVQAGVACRPSGVVAGLAEGDSLIGGLASGSAFDSVDVVAVVEALGVEVVVVVAFGEEVVAVGAFGVEGGEVAVVATLGEEVVAVVAFGEEVAAVGASGGEGGEGAVST